MQCANCENNFDADVHVPRILITCGHTFCQICIENSMNPDEDDSSNVLDCFECGI